VHHDDTGNMGTEGTEQSSNANRKAGKLNTYHGFNIFNKDICMTVSSILGALG